MPRFFEAGPEGPAKEITDEDELLRIKLRRELSPLAKKDWVQKLLKTSNMTEEEWTEQRVEEEFKRIKKLLEKEGEK